MDRVGVFGRRFVGDIPSTLLSILYYGRTESDRHLLCCARVPWLGEGRREGLTDLLVARSVTVKEKWDWKGELVRN